MLKIIRAKPNPEGESKHSKTIIKPELRLACEWFDIFNTSFFRASLENIEIYSLDYKDNKKGWVKVISFYKGDNIPGRKAIRVHSGNIINVERLRRIDRGVISNRAVRKKIVHDHYFTKKQYILSNSSKDRIMIWDKEKEKTIDQVTYKNYIPEGAILNRDGDKLLETDTF